MENIISDSGNSGTRLTLFVWILVGTALGFCTVPTRWSFEGGSFTGEGAFLAEVLRGTDRGKGLFEGMVNGRDRATEAEFGTAVEVDAMLVWEGCSMGMWTGDRCTTLGSWLKTQFVLPQFGLSGQGSVANKPSVGNILVVGQISAACPGPPEMHLKLPTCMHFIRVKWAPNARLSPSVCQVDDYDSPIDHCLLPRFIARYRTGCLRQPRQRGGLVQAHSKR